MCSTLVPAAEEITADQSTCLFKAAGLSVEDFNSSSTLKTRASVKHKHGKSNTWSSTLLTEPVTCC